MSYRSLLANDLDQLEQFGLSKMVLSMFTEIGTRHLASIVRAEQLSQKLAHRSLQPSDPLIEFGAALNGIRYAGPGCKSLGVNRVLGAEISLLTNGSIRSCDVDLDARLVRCGSIWSAPDDFWLNEQAELFFGRTKVASSIRPFLEMEAFSFFSAEKRPIAHRYFLHSSAARSAIDAIRHHFTAWTDLEPGYAIATAENVALKVSRYWGAPDECWELTLFVKNETEADALSAAIREKGIQHDFTTRYSIREGWN
jgi:hypothetical protein